MQFNKLVVGLTGGIGSGKSTVAGYFAERGVTIIDTDQLSRDLTQPGEKALASIVEKFGADILLKDGQLNRKALREIIFNDAEKRIWLENLLHPLIQAETSRLLEADRSPYCIVVIPLLFETARNPLINRVLVVDAPEELQISRAMDRDQLSIAEVQAILKIQVTREERQAGADDIIFNDKDPENLILQVDKLHDSYLSISL